jgi:GNAT superfamily N-acetyltransferase
MMDIRRAETDADLEAIAAIVSEATPDEAATPELMRAADVAFPGGARFVARLAGRIVGAASTGRFYIYPPDYPANWAAVTVRPEARRRGVGTALLVAVAEAARHDGRVALQVVAAEERPAGVAFLRRYGFEVRERRMISRLDLDRVDPRPPDDPPGVRITTLAAEPDLLPGVHRAAIEGFADIPGADRRGPGDLASFRERYVERATIPAAAYFVAECLDSREVVGYASLKLRSPGGSVASHYMTTVRRRWRGRGIGLALKQHTIAWAAAQGLTELESDPHDDNVALRAINERLGYEDVTALLTMRGQIATIVDAAAGVAAR